MSDVTAVSSSVLRPEAIMASAQNGFLCWSQACVEVAEGVLSAGIAQLKLVNSMYPTEAGELFSLMQFEKPHEATVQAVARARERVGFTVRSYQQITDELVSHLFHAAGTLASAFEGETKPDNQPIPLQAKKTPTQAH